MTEPTTYNGWTNHATWVVALHLMDDTVDYVRGDIECWTKDDFADAAQVFKDHVDDLIEESEIDSLLLDLLDTSSINYEELGKVMLERAFY